MQALSAMEMEHASSLRIIKYKPVPKRCALHKEQWAISTKTKKGKLPFGTQKPTNYDECYKQREP